MRGALPALCLALLAAERGAGLCTIIHYLVHGQLGWFGLTVACIIPGYAAQLLSILWFRTDGHQHSCWLLVLHLLQLGLWKRYWDVLRAAVKADNGVRAGAELMALGDVCVLRLLEALLRTLPHLLLQAYGVLAVHTATVIPATAILCLLLWRTGMLATRVLALVLFARLYSLWVFAVAGAHWLLMSFWLVAQQTDIVAQPWRWRLFNCLLGAVYIFCYINVRPGPSKHRMAVFYTIMLVENTILLLLATRFLQTELRSSLCVTGAVMAGSVIGAAALVVYYILLHPKSSEIWKSFLDTTCSAATAGGDEAAGDGSKLGQNLGISGDGESSAGGGTMADPKNGHSSSLLQFRGCVEDSWTNHHHWLLVKLALKTGDISTINAAFGDGGMGEVYAGGWVMGKPTCIEPGANLSLPTREMGPRGVESGVTDEKSQVTGDGEGSKPGTTRTAGQDRAGQEPGFQPAVSFPRSFSLDEPEGSSIYFSAKSIASPNTGTEKATCMALVQRDNEAQTPPGCLGVGQWDSPLGITSISPILGTCTHKHPPSSSSLGTPKEGLEPVGSEGAPVGWHQPWDIHPCGTRGTVVRGKLRPPCFTSTPKAAPHSPQQGWGETGQGTDLAELLE
ncbi:XK-related protein 5 isoform X6 [Columba livia]|uniref:XK-related protein 5 isoform X6 n=1 Tax=Columba livia TaxID=8932 RepID=UPI0031BB3E12